METKTKTQNQINAAKAFNESNITDYVYEFISEIKSCGSTCTFFYSDSSVTEEEYIIVDDLDKLIEVLDNNQIDYLIQMGEEGLLEKEFTITIK